MGQVYLRSLIRAQLLLGLSTVALVVVPLIAMPLWVLLGILVYQAILGVGWWYVRQADRNESQFTDLVEGR